MILKLKTNIEVSKVAEKYSLSVVEKVPCEAHPNPNGGVPASQPTVLKNTTYSVEKHDQQSKQHKEPAI